MVPADYFRIFTLQYTPSAEYKEYLFDSRSTSTKPSSNIYFTMTGTSADAQQIFTTLYHMVLADYFRIFIPQYTPSAEYKEYLQIDKYSLTYDHPQDYIYLLFCMHPPILIVQTFLPGISKHPLCLNLKPFPESHLLIGITCQSSPLTV
jgi:hypothetical protein